MTLEDTLNYLDTTSRVSCPSITCEQAAEIAALIRKLHGFFEHYQCKSFDLADAVSRLRSDVVGKFPRDGLVGKILDDAAREPIEQVACGFAWDCGREMAESERALELEKESNAILLECVADLERDKQHRERVDAGLPLVSDKATWAEATGDLDAGIYEGTGKGFEK